MKIIGLLRHAKSSWAQPGLMDFDRPLTDRGRTAAEFMGRELELRGLAFDLVLASPARRVIETIECVEKGYGATLPTSFEPQIYTASSSDLLALFQGSKARLNSILLVGHNPALQDLALLLTSASDPLRADIDQHFPTGSLALLHCMAEHWEELLPRSTRLVAFLRPKKLMGDVSD